MLGGQIEDGEYLRRGPMLALHPTGGVLPLVSSWGAGSSQGWGMRAAWVYRYSPEGKGREGRDPAAGQP